MPNINVIQMFGLKCSLNGFDHHEVSKRKARLFGRALLVVGAGKLPALYPHLVQRMERVFAAEAGNAGNSGELGFPPSPHHPSLCF
jgi:hypothetical protein